MVHFQDLIAQLVVHRKRKREREAVVTVCNVIQKYK